MIKVCVVCGAEFSASPSSKKITCSKACSSVRKSQTHAGKSNVWPYDSRAALFAKGLTQNLAKGTPAAQTSPIAGPFETNRNALIWTIKAPDGAVYRVRNLRLWLRNHADILNGTPDHAWAGLMQIKRSMLGKTKRPVSQWKGWELISWETIKQ